MARIWPPDGFPDAPCPDRLTVKGRADVEERSDYHGYSRPERSDPLTVRPDRVGGGRAFERVRAQRGPPGGAQRRPSRAQRGPMMRVAGGGSASTPC